MGGLGSGGRNKTHGTVENYHRLDSFDFRQYIRLFEDEDIDETLGPLMYLNGDVLYDLLSDTAYIRYGGKYIPLKLCSVEGIDGEKSRLYFCCPHCGRRVRYLHNYKGFYVCRHCLGANYKSQQRNRGLEAIRRKMRKVVEQDLGYTWWRRNNPNRTIAELENIPKPRYMRWTKYIRMMQKYYELQDEYIRQLLKICGAFFPDGWENEMEQLM